MPVHVLAFLGLAAFPSSPGERRLSTAGFDYRGRICLWSWSLWPGVAPYAVACSLLRATRQERPGPGTRRFQSRRLTVNKRPYFLPATAG